LKKKFKEVPVELLRKVCPTDIMKFKTTDDIEPSSNILGQKRAVDALNMGIEMKGKGFNIFITGAPGTGRREMVKSFLGGLEEQKKEFHDICYVNNFQNEDMPTLLALPKGHGVELKMDMENLTETVIRSTPSILESDEYREARKKLTDEYQEKEQEVFKEFEEVLSEHGFGLIQIANHDVSNVRPEIAPLIQDRPVPLRMLEDQKKDGIITKEKFDKIKKTYDELKIEMEKAFRKSRDIGRELKKKLSNLNDDHIGPMIEDQVTDLCSKYKSEKVADYLQAAKNHMVSNIDRLQPKNTGEPPKNEAEAQGRMMDMIFGSQRDPLLPYKVNVIVDNSDRLDDPIVFENFPSYKNLFGCIERVIDARGGAVIDFMKIKAGSLLRADGGYLIVDALDMLMEYGVWQTLKRIMKSGEIEIQNFDPWSFGGTLLKPEPVKVNVKIILIGSSHIYHLLHHFDEDFHKIFKIRADFDSSVQLENESIVKYAEHIKKVTAEEGLLPFSKSGVAAIVEQGLREVGHRRKLSTRFSVIDNIVQESSYWAQKDGKKTVDHKSVEKALQEKRIRLNMVEEKIQEMIEEGVLLIDTEEPKIGQVNGLAVYQLGDYMFGKPSRITAQSSLGRAGILNIEREAEMSGKIHNKGVLILSGYLKGKYAQEFPLSMEASIAFEQSYAGVEGDSASSTEAFALLSSLSGLPLRQGIAVTGSMDQLGQIQPIGGVNDKIEGFFDVCKARGLTGEHGVIIPHQNVEDLMLRKDVVQAVKSKKFHIYPIKTVDEGMEILTGKTIHQVNKLVKEHLKRMNDLMMETGNGNGNNKKGKK